MKIGQLTRDDSWLLELAKIPQEMRLNEPELQSKRWFDYRHQLPAQLTYLFAQRYEAIYREFYAKTRDSESAPNIQVTMYEDVFNSPELLCFWNARQTADEIGCDYDFYIRFCMNRTWERAWKYLPRPNQLYGDEIKTDATAAWNNQLKYSLKLSLLDYYMNANYEGHPDQDAYHLYLVAQVNAREQKHMLLARLILKEKCLPLSVAKTHFDKSVLYNALTFHNN